MADPKKLIGKLRLDITHLRNRKNLLLRELGSHIFAYYLQNRNSGHPVTLTPEAKKALEGLLELETTLDTLKIEIETLKKTS